MYTRTRDRDTADVRHGTVAYQILVFAVTPHVCLAANMLATKEKRVYGLQRDFQVLEREKRVTKILASHAFRSELEGILQGQLEGSRGPPKTSHALSSLQDNVAPAAAVEAAHMHAAAAGVSGTSGILPINDLRGARSSRYVLSERRLRCKLASLCRLVDWFKWSPLVNNHLSVSNAISAPPTF